MIIGLVNFLIFNYFLFVESQPYGSVSQDLRIIKECNLTYPTDRHTLNVALVEKHFEFDMDRNFKCFLHCLYEKYDWMTYDGTFKEKEIKLSLGESNLDESSIEYLLATCVEIDAEDKCDRAHLFTECFWTETDKLVSFI
ncbi:hypothetical protein RUM44_012428 [Polyplax serrata]|uniref:Uncharacterized protein n=1 Tax=Polyplax serrata TaxID=468196 RepID=A0ABR1BF27_POLSC